MAMLEEVKSPSNTILVFPLHCIELQKNGKMTVIEDVFDLRKDTNGAYTLFCDHVLAAVVGKSLWKTKSVGLRISTIATVSDEAFALLLLLNSWDVWNESNTASNKQARYTRNGAGTKKGEGWTMDGLVKFNEFAIMVRRDRKANNNMFEAAYLDNKANTLAGKGRKSKKGEFGELMESEKFSTYKEGDDDDDDDDNIVNDDSLAGDGGDNDANNDNDNDGWL